MAKTEQKPPIHWQQTLDMVEQLRLLVFHPFITGKPSEADYVHEWKNFLRPFLGMSGEILTKSGEYVSRSSSDIKAILEKNVRGFGAHGRKTDLLFVSGKHELSRARARRSSMRSVSKTSD